MDDVFDDVNTQNKEADDKRKRRHLRDIDDLKGLVKLPAFRRFFWTLWGLTGVFRASYTPKDSNMTAFREGQRDIGLVLLQNLNEASPTALGQMRSEYLSELKSELKDKQENNDD